MTALRNIQIKMRDMQCPECGVLFSMPQTLHDEAKRHSSQSWYCPNGHSRHFAKSKDQLRIAELEDTLRKEEKRRSWAESDATAARKELKKNHRRIGNGVCPCCNRTFKQLQRHMKNKHPEYVKEAK